MATVHTATRSHTQEVEIKFRISDLKAISHKLRAAGFRVKTKRTHETNTLFDLPTGQLRKRGEVLRIRKYGRVWTVTHKSKGKAGRHKSRAETETQIADGETLGAIFSALGLVPSFRYEKFRTEWTDGNGHVVIDETPIGNVGEIEGDTDWIDRTAKTLGIEEADYCTKSYAELFLEWKRASRSKANEMTWSAIDRGVHRN